MVFYHVKQFGRILRGSKMVLLYPEYGPSLETNSKLGRSLLWHIQCVLF